MSSNVLLRYSRRLAFAIGLSLCIGAASLTAASSARGVADLSTTDYLEVFCGAPPPFSRPAEPVVRPPHDGPITVDVSISGFAFNPPSLTINVGDTVRWTNNDGSTHTTTSDTAVWDSGFLSNGQTFSFTFTSPGKFPYHCNPHPFMTASITVLGPSPTLVINEIDYDQPGTDTAEFIELKNVSGGTINLDSVVVELINDAACCSPYQSFDLPNVNLAADDYYVICGDGATVLNCDLPVTPGINLIQNGAPDAVGLRISGSLVDAVSYEGDTDAPYTEGSGTGLADDNVTAFIGLSRFPDGADTNVNNVDLSLRCITPGTTNASASTGCTGASPTPTPTATSTPTNTPTITATATPTDTPTATNTATPTPTSTPFSGSYNVGTGQTYTSLTMPGGIFEAINTLGVSGDVTINITSDLSGEDGVVPLNEFTPGFSILIKPSGGPRTITGAGTTGIIRLDGANNVTIDGSTSGSVVTGVVGGNPAFRELTVENTSASTASGVIVLHSGPNGAQENTIKNLNILGSGPDQTGYAISIGGATAGTLGADNDFNTIENCSLRRAIIGIYSNGGSVSNQNFGTTIRENDITGTGADRIRRVGVVVSREDLVLIYENSIGGIESNESEDAIGIALGLFSISNNTSSEGGITQAEIYRNKINGVKQTNGRSAAGIALTPKLGSPNGGQIFNNMVSGVISDATGSSIVAGIFVAGTAGAQVAHNSVSMTGDRGATASQAPSYALAITASNPPVSVVDNILYTTQTSGGGTFALSYAIGTQSGSFTAFTSNYNVFWSSGANAGGFRTASLAGGGAGVDYANLTAWRSATSEDLNSIEGDPLFINPANDPHIQTTSPAKNTGTDAGYQDDFDGDVRPQEGLFEIGADELLAATPTATPTPAETPAISGVITYGNAIGSPAPPRFVKNVSVASTAGSPAVGPVITGTPGTYTLTGFGAGSYTIKPSKPGGATTAITSNDAARVAQGVSGSLAFVSQNQRFAADVTGNGNISSQDAAKIAQFVAGLPFSPPNLTGQWKFFTTGAPSPLPTPPQVYNDSRTYPSVTTNLNGEDFVGILVGEVSGNWNPVTHPRPGTVVGGQLSVVSGDESGAAKPVTVTVEQVATVAEKKIVIPVNIEGAVGKDIISYEFDLRYDPAVMQPLAEAVDVKGTVSRGLLVVTNPYEPGLLRVVVYGPMPITEDGVLLNLRFISVGAVGSVSSVVFERIMFNEGDSPVLLTDGRVEVLAVNE